MANIKFQHPGEFFPSQQDNGSPKYRPVIVDQALQPGLVKSTMDAFHRALTTNGVKARDGYLPTKECQFASRARDGNELSLQKLFQDEKKAGTQLLLFIIKRKENEPYKTIKYLGDVKFGIHTICVVGEKLVKERGQLQYFANVALKFNLKLAGANQVLEAKALPFVDNGDTMLVGLDVTHPSPGSSDDAPSVAALVASSDKLVAQFPALLRIQPSRQEMVTEDNLVQMMRTRLARWQLKNKSYPRKIIMYRDGVSEGQYDQVVDFELQAIRKACQMETSKVKPAQPSIKITIVVCGKRHNTRFYPSSKDPQVTDARTSNPVAGTIVDRHVTDPRDWDFYLQAHQGLHGTAKPCHYVVVHDEIFADGATTPADRQAAHDRLELLTHNLCYMFGRATKAVSLCPPAYYADLAAERARAYLKSLFDDDANSPEQSEASGADDQRRRQVFNDALLNTTIHPDIAESMFYI